MNTDTQTAGEFAAKTVADATDVAHKVVADAFDTANQVRTAATNDHDILIRMDEKMNTVIKNQAVEIIERGKLESRVRQLENFRYFVAGGAWLFGVVGGLLAELAFHLFK